MGLGERARGGDGALIGAGHDAPMTLRVALGATLILAITGGADAATRRKPVAPPAPVVLGDSVRVVLTTDLGAITIDLDHLHAPVTTENFVAYVDQKRFDGTVFYRAMRLGPDGTAAGLVQGGTQNDPRRILKPIAHEPTTQTGILHKAWTISMARYAPGTATGDFSILLSDLPSLDADPKAAGDTAGYAAFGRVVEGQDTVRRIYDSPPVADTRRRVHEGPDDRRAGADIVGAAGDRSPNRAPPPS